MNPELLLPFALATLTFAAMPGPGILYTVGQTVALGRSAGLAAVAGIHLGGWVHVVAAAAGLSALFAAAPSLYAALKLAGAAYLVFMGLRLLLARAETGRTGPAPRRRTLRRALLDSAAVEVLNPKTALFFVAFLPQFADPAAALPVWAQLAILGAVVNLAFSVADAAAALMAGWAARAAREGGLGAALARRAGGCVLVGLGAHLALSRG